MKITKVEALYLRQPEVKVASAPLAVKGAIQGPYSHSITSGLGQLLIG